MGLENISHYRILGKLGEGGMGVVFKAHDERLKREVALKVLKPHFATDSEHRQRFIREARSAACLAHPFIASVYDSDEVEGSLFIVMEYVQGKTLRVLVQDGAGSLRDKLRIASEIAEGIAEAHIHHIIHRDLKPDNVMVASNGHAKILDFGLAKLVETRDEATTKTFSVQEPGSGLTYEGEILGTPIYMSPEQARGEAVDCRSDLFSFGSTLYEMVSGTAPFQRETRQDTLAAILGEEPAPLSEMRPEAPRELERIIGRCLRKKPEERYNATQDLVVALHDLRQIVETQSSARTRSVRPLPPPPQPRLSPAKKWIAVLLAVVFVVVLFRWLWGPTQDTGRPNFILVGEFEGPEDDPDLGVATRELIRATLEESETVMPISNAELARGRDLAGLAPDVRVVGGVARELAIRAAARTYLEGRVDRIFDGYTITLRLLDAETGDLVFAISEVAESDAVYIAKLDRLGRELRKKIGDRRQALQSTRPHEQVITPSLEAYRHYVDGVELRYESKYAASNRKLRQALALDPDFALAWLGLGQNYRNEVRLDSAKVAFDQALHRVERLTDAQRLELQAFIALDVEHDLPRALEIVNDLVALRAAHQSGAPGRTHHGRALLLELMGRGEEALTEYKRVAQVSPYGPNQMLLANQVNTMLVLGKPDQARTVLPQMRGKRAQIAELGLPLAEFEWKKVEEVAGRLRNDPDALRRARIWAGLALASVSAARGALDEAASTLEDVVQDAPSAYWSEIACFARLFLQMVRSQRSDLLVPCSEDTTSAGLLLHGMVAASQGRVAEAELLLQQFRRRPAPDQRQYDASRRLLEARIAAHSGRWQDVVVLLEPLASVGPLPNVTGRRPLRWLLAEASERLDDTTGAARHYESLLVQTGSDIDLYNSGITYAFARARLVILYANMGRIEQAQVHWKILNETCTSPDAAFLPLIDESRQALAEAKAK